METASDIVEAQQRVCAKFSAEFCPCDFEERAGVAMATLGREPVHGIRETNDDGSKSWYIWGGEYSSGDDFFQPICAGHLRELLATAMPYLALPSGYRFMIDHQGFEDVWRDPEINSEQGVAPQSATRSESDFDWPLQPST